MNLQEFQSRVTGNRTQREAQREALIERGRQAQRALHEAFGHLVAATEEHLPEAQAMDNMDAGKPFLCGCLPCCLRMVLPAAILHAAASKEQGKEQGS